ncbi:hypothetical protein ACQSSU_20575 [Micromonospora echinospora]
MTNRHGGPLTPDRVLQALSALGTPVVMLDEPTPDDLPRLLGQLTASLEAALDEHAMGNPDQVKQFGEGYAEQLANDGLGAAKLINARLTTIAFQLEDSHTDDGGEVLPFEAAAQASMAAASLIAYQLYVVPDRTGQRADDSVLREFLRDARRSFGNAKRSYDRLVDKLKGRGFRV